MVDKAKTQTLVALTDGIGKLEVDDPNEKIAAMERPPIPKDKLETYVTESKAAFDDLLVAVRQELSRNKETLNDMKKGANYMPEGNADVLRVIDARNNKTKKYFFRSQTVKEREISKISARNKALQNITTQALKDKTSKDVLYALLSKSGPRLDPRLEGSIGFMSEATVLVAFNKNGVIIMYDEAPYLLWVDSAAGLFTGSELTPVPVYVAGTETVEIPGQTPQVVTMLYTVTDAELKQAIYGDEQSSAPSSGATASAPKEEYRVWKDVSGKFQIEATLVQANEKEVVLKKRDGKTITVPLNKLSPPDRKFLKK
jgi:hypothetical protein